MAQQIRAGSEHGTESERRAFDDGSINQLLASIGRAHRNIAGLLLRNVNLFPGQELLLMQLWNRDHRPQGDLVNALRLEASTVTKMLQRLETQGYVTRHRPDNNQRIVIVSLTDLGRALQSEVERLWHQLEAATLGEMSAAQFRHTRTVLERLERNLTTAHGKLAASRRA